MSFSFTLPTGNFTSSTTPDEFWNEYRLMTGDLVRQIQDLPSDSLTQLETLEGYEYVCGLLETWIEDSLSSITGKTYGGTIHTESGIEFDVLGGGMELGIDDPETLMEMTHDQGGTIVDAIQ